ncbi:uncharacterized protein LOC141622017 [Silene latifolia]|uniref:uncharacterized protein LOC141622017 n=1 Tax=Silene latifolia TaxID=37657 RepID=UPI003D78AC9D
MDVTNCNTPIVVDEDWLKNIVTGPPYQLRELKLLETCDWHFGESSLTALLDGLFWSCHPDVLSIAMSFQTAELILDILKSKVECWKHPLKSIEVEGADLSTLLSRPSKLEIRCRLSWKSF